MQDIKTNVRQFIAANLFLGARKGEIADDESFLELGILDSTGVIELISFLEETYSIRIEDDEITPENLDTLANIERHIQSKLVTSDPTLSPASLSA